MADSQLSTHERVPARRDRRLEIVVAVLGLGVAIAALAILVRDDDAPDSGVPPVTSELLEATRGATAQPFAPDRVCDVYVVPVDSQSESVAKRLARALPSRVPVRACTTSSFRVDSAALDFRRGQLDGVVVTDQLSLAFQQARGLLPTGKLDAATASALGLSPAPPPPAGPQVNVVLEAKPVQGPCDYRDSWLAPRSNGRVHLGTDIIAREGNALYAVAAGRISQIYRVSDDSLSGNALKITKPDGTYFFYGHLSAFAAGIDVGSQVNVGQVVGYVGKTGYTLTPHLHIEVHPGGGAAINPYPLIRAIGAC